MNLSEISKGMRVVEAIGDEVVTVVRIGATKHYGPLRSVQVRFDDKHLEYYAPEDLTPVQEDTK